MHVRFADIADTQTDAAVVAVIYDSKIVFRMT
jgi:hypothetical protein